VHSAAVDWNIEIGSFDVPSELHPVHGITPAISILSDERDFKTDRASYKPDDLTDSREGETGGQTSDSICVKLLRRHPCSQAGLVAIKQVSNSTPQVASERSHLPEVLPRISEVEKDFTPELSPHP
jgi:hypothetical protein